LSLKVDNKQPQTHTNTYIITRTEGPP
jgi:hypothetical protein